MLPFRLLPFAAALLLSPVLFPGAAEAGWGLEVTPYAGYTIGGNFEDNTTGADLDVKDGGNFGLVLGVPDTPETRYELFYGFQRTKVTGGGTKIPISGHVGLRFEGRGFLTILPDATEVFCVSAGGAACSVRVKGDVLGQLLLMAGITFSL